MKAKLTILTLFSVTLLTYLSCSKDDENKVSVESIELSVSAIEVNINTTVNFTVTTNLDQIVTSESDIYINGELSNLTSFMPNSPGEYNIKAIYSTGGREFESNVVTVIATEIPLTEIVLSSSANQIEMGDQFTFFVHGDNSTSLTNDSSFFINDELIESNVYIPLETGEYEVRAEYTIDGLTYNSNAIQLTVIAQSTEIMFFDEIVFYDGYAATVNEPVPSGITRVNNASYVTKITDEHISQINEELEIEVIIGALCDNYDRIGNLFLNLVNQGDDYSESNIVERIEIGRFITPFMNKNVSPDEVPYLFQVDNIAKILNDQNISSTHDFFLEFNVFGVPYAANEQVAGCSGRNDVFRGTVIFKSRNESYTPQNQYLESVTTYFNFNDYDSGASDAIGQSIKTFNFTTTTDISDAQIHVVISNHGANSGGEEYERRQHFLYMDGMLVDSYTPGGESCEPFRVYNTQANGIYGPTPRPDSVWASFSNWCPGDVIPIRTYDLGSVSAGAHTFVLDVPDAQFVDNQGYFPVSVYLQGEL
ncbi:peptide-N-glycosidase F-related protein [Winogradskyella sp. SYSU M77433]|uniref:peptide-N-glycosidase F-related protein n=1 Tax=Winogradskyella sp. SYSU M77433 TaxID=3042722 RepID=UPI0024817D16|nr:peptide-N-glycosidase F-related protein [Winogradskyella sp. SYSU M77433]MDH7911268.1 peptide-N-glycosidase F-related protein [Winogradskyella sp. SYSU M77433]